ncbi:MAG: DUF1566 domain-containing protein, partial [Leptospiraceae bacterium]|nr:DUF1566 domain-containing protein [Leptospiraceae bacterium]
MITGFLACNLDLSSLANSEDSDDGKMLMDLLSHLAALPPVLTAELMDVHGAGAQRSDPKSGSAGDYPQGHGPQGDVVYVHNFARCVRGSSSSARSYAVVDTGQSNCYGIDGSGAISCPGSGSAYGGQDASYTGLAASYTDNGNGTVTDHQTGLMWQKSFQRLSWEDAMNAAASDTTGGYTDWRVPTIKELYSLMNFDGVTGTADPSSSSAPADAVAYLDTSVFDFEYPSDARYIDAQYISATSYTSTVFNGQAAFFGVNFADGRIKG